MSKAKRRERAAAEPSKTVAAGRRRTSEAAVAPPPSPNRVLGVGLAVYLAILAAMVAFDSYTFVLKSAVIPVLLLAAVLSRRFSGFVNDWALFLGVIVLLDSLRSAAYAVITHFQLPMYVNYAIDWERRLCGGSIAPLVAQQIRAGLENPRWLDRLFVLLHASHFLVFLLFGFLLWSLRRAWFRTYAVAMAVLLALGLSIQFLVPTFPPWLAAREFQLLPPMDRLISSVYNVHLPSLAAMFDLNPIAAMPSLHTAMPVLCALVALHYLGWRGTIVVVYALGVALGVIYLGEHYLVDVVAGVLLALVVYAGIRRWGEPAVPIAQVEAGSATENLRPRPIVAAVVLVVCAYGFGQLATLWLKPLPLTRTFIERELVDRSPVAHFLLGRNAFAARDDAEAQSALNLALGELRHPTDQNVIRYLLGQSAQRAGNHSGAIAALEPLRATTGEVENLVVLARAYVGDARYDDGIAVLREARQRFPAEPEPLYWLTRLQYESHRIDRAEVAAALVTLAHLPSAKAPPLQRSLSTLLNGG